MRSVVANETTSKLCLFVCFTYFVYFYFLIARCPSSWSPVKPSQEGTIGGCSGIRPRTRPEPISLLKRIFSCLFWRQGTAKPGSPLIAISIANRPPRKTNIINRIFGAAVLTHRSVCVSAHGGVGPQNLLLLRLDILDGRVISAVLCYIKIINKLVRAINVPN